LLALGQDSSASSSKNNYGDARRINIALIGVDGRFGSSGGHADANHILSIMPDIGKIEIISIPRDSYVYCGYEDSTGLNKLTVFYMARGKKAYLDTIAKIARLGSVPYYIEFGFSQAMGILRWLGFNSSQTLQVLRTRKSFAVGDYQRVYNQAQFIRQAMVRNFGLLNGPLRPVVLRGILALTRTNLTYDKTIEIADALGKTSFAESADNISIKVRPSLRVNFKVFDFTDQQSVSSLRNNLDLDHIAEKDTTAFSPKDFQGYLTKKIEGIIYSAAKDTLKNPTLAINKVKNIYTQKVWLQIADTQKSLGYSRQISAILITSYNKKKDTLRAIEVWNALKAEEDFFKMQKN
jgi:anionic cell wall polymer biosynthesis LytR-Cps2A-Psr (LCP) family protein